MPKRSAASRTIEPIPADTVRPILKWAGGKRQLLPALRRYYPAGSASLYEPSGSELTEQELLDEWGREFLAEGRRRTDLIRFNKFTTGSWYSSPAAWPAMAAVPAPCSPAIRAARPLLATATRSAFGSLASSHLRHWANDWACA